MHRTKSRSRTDDRRGTEERSPWLNFLLLIALAGIVTLSISFSFHDEQNATSAGQTATQPPAEGGQPNDTRAPAVNGNGQQESFFTRLFENKDLSADLSKSGAWRVILTKVPLRLLLAALLAAMIAYRPQKFLFTMPRNPHVAQTQILLAVVAAALMIIVADSAARAFAIFAAAALVRFRTGIRDPKEVTVMLICLAIGLGTGVGHLALAVIFSLFVLLLLWVLESREPAQIVRALNLKVRTRNVDQTLERLKGLFLSHRVNAEVRALNRQDEDDPLGKIVYRVSLQPNLNTDNLSEELFTEDQGNIDSIKWQQKKSISYFYS